MDARIHKWYSAMSIDESSSIELQYERTVNLKHGLNHWGIQFSFRRMQDLVWTIWLYTATIPADRMKRKILHKSGTGL